MDYVNLNNVSYRAGVRETVQGINAGFAEKKVTAIIGKSGSGKSTLIKIINGLLRPSQGTVLIRNQAVDYEALPTLRGEIGYVVQGIGLFPHRTARENILLPGKVHGRSIDARRLSELINLVNLPDGTLEKYPHELSGGEQQRVGISRALVLDPPLLLMDEPFGSLDPVTRFSIHEEFLRLQRSMPRTVLLVTHDLREAKKLADDLLVIDEGRIQQYGSVESIIANPQTPATKELIKAADL